MDFLFIFATMFCLNCWIQSEVNLIHPRATALLRSEEVGSWHYIEEDWQFVANPTTEEPI